MKIRPGTLSWTSVCYGVDLQDDCAVIVRARRHGFGKVDYEVVPADDPSFLEDVRNGAPCAGCLTTRESFARWLDAPFASMRKTGKVLPTLLDIQLPFALEDCIYSFAEICSLKGTKNVTRALAVAARSSDITRRIDAYRKCGVDPFVLDQEGLAIWTQSLHELPVPPEGVSLPRVIVLFGDERSTVVVGRGADFVSAHAVRSGDVGGICRLLKSDLGSPSDCGGMIQWAWAGLGAKDHDKLSGLAHELFKEWPGASVTHDNPELFLARSLATRALVSGPLRCNLRSGAMAHPVLTRRKAKQSSKAACLSLAAGLILCFSNLASRWIADAKLANLNTTYAAVVDELAGYPVVGAKGKDALNIARGSVEKRKEMLSPFKMACESHLFEDVKSLTAVGRENGLVYGLLSAARNKVMISGTAGDWESCEALLGYLDKAGYEAVIDRGDALFNDRVPFAIVTGGRNE